MKETSIQRRIGLIQFGFCILIPIGNYFSRVYLLGADPRAVLMHPNVWLFASLAPVSLLIGLVDHVALRVVQVAILFFVGLMSILYNDPEDVTGAVFIVLSILLSHQYRLLKQRATLKVLILLAAALTTNVVSIFVFKKNADIYSAVWGVVSSGGLFLLFWSIFSEEIREWSTRNRELRKQIDSHKAFVQLGQNVTVVVHNFRNIANAVHGFASLIETLNRQGRTSEIGPAIERLKEASNTFDTRIEDLLLVTRSMRDDQLRLLHLNRLLSATVELFKFDRGFSGHVNCSLDFVDDVYLRASSADLAQVFENIIRNSWEAIEERREKGADPEYEGKLLIRAFTENGKGCILFEDNGVGIPDCEKCKNRECLECRWFKMGVTSKPEGNGIGMAYVLSKVMEFGEVEIDSRVFEWTRILIRLNHPMGTAEVGNGHESAKLALPVSRSTPRRA